jgi:hypothetical protein
MRPATARIRLIMEGAPGARPQLATSEEGHTREACPAPRQGDGGHADVSAGEAASALGIIVEGIGMKLPIVAVPHSTRQMRLIPRPKNVDLLRSWGVTVL